MIRASIAVALLASGAVGVGARAVGLSGGPAGPTPAQRQASRLGVSRDIGQLIIATYSGPTPPALLLSELRQGWYGGVILMADNVPNVTVTRAATAQLQRAARAGGRPGLLIMTDQEGGEVERFAGAPPGLSAATMGRLAGRPGGLAQVAALGRETGTVLRQAGVNLDLAPVADVVRNPAGFIATQGRSFGSNPSAVAAAACSFAAGLSRAGVGATLKHFPGLGDAGSVSTDTAPVAIGLTTAQLRSDAAAYRRCGGAATTATMVSSASYPSETGSLPAVLASHTYTTLLPQDGVHGLVISDSFSTGSIAPQRTPALRALAAGLDMVMYPNRQTDAEGAYRALLGDARSGRLGARRILAAAAQVLAFKRTLGLG